MICPICHKREATEEVGRTFGELRLSGKVCFSCLEPVDSLSAEGFYNVFFKGLKQKCPRCGRSLGEILHTMIVGCPYCYKEFENELTPLIRSVQRLDNK